MKTVLRWAPSWKACLLLFALYVIIEPFFLSSAINPRILAREDEHAAFAQWVFENSEQFERLAGADSIPAQCFVRRAYYLFSYRYCIVRYLPLIVPGDFSMPIALLYPKSIVSRLIFSDYSWYTYFSDPIAHVNEEGARVIGPGAQVY